MNLIKKNIMANFAGNIWQALMSLAFIPLYIKFMGVESYGLIGIFASLQAIFLLLDMGLSATLTRETARLSVLPGKEQVIRDLVHSLQIIYWAVALLIGIVVLFLAPVLAHHWVKAGKLPTQTIEQALRMMGLAMALQWPASFYSGGLAGLQKQILLNVINCSIGTLRGLGAVLILWLVSPTIQAFFTWQIIISIVNTFSMAFFLWNSLVRTGKKASFKKQLLLGVWRFAAGMSGIAVLSTILTQLDKVIFSKMLSLEAFGYYTLAGVVAMSLYRITGPVWSAIYPKFTQLVSISDTEGLKLLYHKSCQIMSVLILPVAIIIALFSYEILLIWTRNPITAEKTHVLVSILICGFGIGCMGHIPYALQLSNGWTKLSIYTNLVSVSLLAPLMIYLTNSFGVIGGASVWVILNCGYFLIVTPMLHKRLMPGENWHYYWQDVGMPLAASLVIAGLGRLLINSQTSQLLTIIFLIIISTATLASAAIAAPATREWLFKKITDFKFLRLEALQ